MPSALRAAVRTTDEALALKDDDAITASVHSCPGSTWSGPLIRKLPKGGYRLYSRKKDPRTGKRRNLGTFPTREAAEQHEREVQYFKRRG